MRDIEPEESDWEDDYDPEPSGTRRIMRRALRGGVTLTLLACFAWFWWLFIEIRTTSYTIQTLPADAIAVFGAAEYNGRPSPVLHARLEHALDLYRRGLAPLLISLGGGARAQYDPQMSEGAVGRDFFLTHGVPDRRIIAETTSSNTEESVDRLAAMEPTCFAFASYVGPKGCMSCFLRGSRANPSARSISWSDICMRWPATRFGDCICTDI